MLAVQQQKRLYSHSTGDVNISVFKPTSKGDTVLLFFSPAGSEVQFPVRDNHLGM